MKISMRQLKRGLFIASIGVLMSACSTLEGAGSELEGSLWTLQSINDQVIAANHAPTLSFDNGEKLGGSGGCNRYFSQYKIEDEAFSVGDIGSTRKLCSANRMEIEKQYLSVLREAVKVENLRAQLVLTTEAGDRLIFEKGVAAK